MTNIFIICLVITVSITYIYKIDAPNQIVSYIFSVILRHPVTVELKKPFGCPSCLSFWITLILLLIYQPQFCWVSLGYYFSVKYIEYTICVVESILNLIFTKIDKILNVK